MNQPKVSSCDANDSRYRFCIGKIIRLQLDPKLIPFLPYRYFVDKGQAEL